MAQFGATTPICNTNVDRRQSTIDPGGRVISATVSVVFELE